MRLPARLTPSEPPVFFFRIKQTSRKRFQKQHFLVISARLMPPNSETRYIFVSSAKKRSGAEFGPANRASSFQLSTFSSRRRVQSFCPALGSLGGGILKATQKCFGCSWGGGTVSPNGPALSHIPWNSLPLTSGRSWRGERERHLNALFPFKNIYFVFILVVNSVDMAATCVLLPCFAD